MGLGRTRKREVVAGWSDGTVAAGEEDGDEGLFEVVVRAFAFDERAAEEFDFLPIEFGAVQAAEADVESVGERSGGERGEECVGVTVGALDVDGVKRAGRRVEPVSEKIGSAEEEEVGIEDEFPTGGAQMRVGEFADVGIFFPAIAKNRETFAGKKCVETGDGFGAGDKASEREEAGERVTLGGGERAVVVDGGRECAARVRREGVETESSLIPEAVAGEEVEGERRGVGRYGKRRQVVGGDFHGGAALFSPALFEGAAGGEEFLHGSDWRVVGAVEEASGELAWIHERAGALAWLKRRS